MKLKYLIVTGLIVTTYVMQLYADETDSGRDYEQVDVDTDIPMADGGELIGVEAETPYADGSDGSERYDVLLFDHNSDGTMTVLVIDTLTGEKEQVDVNRNIYAPSKKEQKQADKNDKKDKKDKKVMDTGNCPEGVIC